MSHQRSIVHHYFPAIVQVLEKSFLKKSCSNSKKNTKLLKKASFLLT